MQHLSPNALFLLFLTLRPHALISSEPCQEKAAALGATIVALGGGLYLLNAYSKTLVEENENPEQIFSAAQASYYRIKNRYKSLINSPEKLSTHPSASLLEKELVGINIPELRSHERKLQKLVTTELPSDTIKEVLSSLFQLRTSLEKEIVGNPLFKKNIQKERRFQAYLAKSTLIKNE